MLRLLSRSLCKRLCAPFALSALTLAAWSVAAGAATLPANLGGGLRPLLERQAAEARAAAAGVPAQQLADQEEQSNGLVVRPDRLMRDADGRVLVNVLLDGRVGYDAVRRAVAALAGVRLTAEDRRYRAGILEGYVPVAALPALAQIKGVSAVQGVMRPVRNVGSVTQQGVVQHRVDQVSQDGSGITVGILSDSYNTAQSFLATGQPLTVREAQDIASGDLPGAGNPAGNTQPVVVLQDFGVFPNPSADDEGRAMAQLVHDIAPKARLGFATAFNGEVGFANNIRALAGVQGLPTSNPNFAAQIVVDDVYYLSEGMFADTIVAQAVDDVTALGVSYFSSAGNRPPTQAYAADFKLVPVGPTATAGTNIDLSAVPPALYAGGFHDFSPAAGARDIAQNLVLTPPASGRRSTLELVFQWDDPYDRTPATIGDLLLQQSGAVTAAQPQADFVFNNPAAGQQVQIVVQGSSTKTPGADFDAIVSVIQPDGTTLVTQDTGASETLLLFLPQAGPHTIRVTGFEGDEGTFTVTVNKASGVAGISTDFNLLFFRPDGSYIGASAENNLSTNRPVELPGTLTFPPGVSTVQLVIARANTPTAPQPARRLRYVNFDSSYPSEYFSYQTPAAYGHNSAAGANGVAAYSPFPPNIPEDFTSTGPVRVVFDRDNNRIPEAQQVRQKPNLAAMDGGNTTFFISDTSRDADTFPNFFGTSAAAPNAAAIGALVLQAHGGPGSVTPAQMRSVLQRSAFLHDLDFYSAQGQATAGNGGVVTVTIEGDNSATSQSDPNATRVGYSGPGSIATIVFDGTNANPGGGSVTNPSTPGLVFDIRRNTGEQVNGGQRFIFGPQSVGLTPGDVRATYRDPAPAPSVPGQFYKLKLDFTAGAFSSGKTLRFGIDRDEQSSAFPATPTRNGSSADLTGSGVRIPGGTVARGGMTFTGTLSDGSVFRGVLANRIGVGYSGLDGYGFINAERAVALPLP